VTFLDASAEEGYEVRAGGLYFHSVVDVAVGVE